MLAAGTNHAGNRVRETASEGTRTVLTSFCLYAKHLARIRKIPCAYTQNFLAYTQNKTEKNHLLFNFSSIFFSVSGKFFIFATVLP